MNKCKYKGCNREVSEIEAYKTNHLCYKHGLYYDRVNKEIRERGMSDQDSIKETGVKLN